MTNNSVADLVAVIRNALDFANRAAGEGIEIDGQSPEDFLMEYSDATGNEDWDSLPDRIAAIVSAALSPAATGPVMWAQGCGYPCGYDCNGACFNPQPVPMTTERNQALAQAAAAAAMDMRERAATHTQWTAWGERHVLTEAARKAIRALPIDSDAQEALDKLLAETRENAIKEAVAMQGCVSTTRP